LKKGENTSTWGTCLDSQNRLYIVANRRDESGAIVTNEAPAAAAAADNAAIEEEAGVALAEIPLNATRAAVARTLPRSRA